MMGSVDTELGDANLPGNSDNAVAQDGLHQFELGKYLLSKDRPGEAVGLLREALRMDPGSAIFATACAHALQLEGCLDEAVKVLTVAVSHNLEDGLLRYNLASLQMKAGLVDLAVTSFEEVLGKDPDDADAWHGLGLACLERGEYPEALVALGRAVTLDPESASFLYDLGNAHLDAEDFAGAAEIFQGVLQLAPEHTDALTNLANALVQGGNLEDAEVAVARAIRMRSCWLDYMNLGQLELARWQFSGSASAFKRATELAPEQWEAWSCRGVIAHEQGDFDRAITYYDQGLLISSDHPEILWNRSLTLLAQGDFKQGWDAYESRWKRPSFTSPKFKTGLPKWEGQRGKLLLHTEQGLGDCLQFVRFLPAAKKRCGEDVHLRAEPALVRLLESAGLAGRILSKGGEFDHAHYDYHLPVMSLPHVLGLERASYPASAPYLFASEVDAQGVAHLLGSAGTPRVGLMWEGNQQNVKGLKRSIPEEQFLECLREIGLDAEYFCLQPESAGADLSLDDGAVLKTFNAAPADLAETAGLLSHMDLVITVDTAVAHLAGAMGIETWLLLCAMPDWRWLNGGENTLWYPHVRIFRQKDPGNWSHPLYELAVELKSRFAS